MKTWLNKLKRTVDRILNTHYDEVAFTYDDIMGIQTVQARLRRIQECEDITQYEKWSQGGTFKVQREKHWVEAPTATDLYFLLGCIFNTAWGSIDHSKHDRDWHTALHQFVVVTNSRLLEWVSGGVEAWTKRTDDNQNIAFDAWMDASYAFIHDRRDAREVLLVDALRAIDWSHTDLSERDTKDSIFYRGNRLRDPDACLSTNPLA